MPSLVTQLPIFNSTGYLPRDQAIRKKWLDLRQDLTWLKNNFEDVKFLVQTRLIYTILGFQNSTADGAAQNAILEKGNEKQKKGLWIKKEGEWVSISKIRQTLRWDAKEHVLISKTNPLEKWGYLSTEGLVAYPQAYEKSLAEETGYAKSNAEMRAIAHLSKKEMRTLMTHAQSFAHPSIDPTSSTCALQFITHPQMTFHPPLLQNLNAQLNVHCGIRLITSDGSIYSFGFGGDYHEHALKKKWYQSLATINGQPKNLDYLEFQKYDQRLVTTVPLDDQQAQEILKNLNLYRREGIRFNLLRQNCVRFATHILHQAGIHVKTRISIKEMIWRALPNIEQLPLVGTTLHAAYVKTAAKISPFAKQKFAFMASVVLFIPSKFADVLINLSLRLLGASRSSPNTSLPLDSSNGGDRLENFEKLFRGLCDPEAAHVYHSSLFVQWQLNQKTTEAYRYSGTPTLNLLPSTLSVQKQESLDIKAQLKSVFH